jgi:dihydroneopterin aldolase
MNDVEPSRGGGAATGRAAHLFVRDLVLPCLIGVHRHERDAKQRVRINLDLTVAEPDGRDDRLASVVNYETIVGRIRDAIASGHVNLVETLAERIAALCLDDSRVRSARVRVEKLDVFPDAASVGIEIERHNKND